MDKAQIAKAIALCKALWPSWSSAPTNANEFETTVGIWQSQLSDLEEASVGRAIVSLSGEGREFVPPVGVIRCRTIELEMRSNGALPPPVEKALVEIRGEIDRVGSRGRPEFSHPVIEAVVRAIGWWEICMSSSPDTVRAHFLRMYGEAATMHVRMEAEPPMIRELGSRVAEIGPGYA